MANERVVISARLEPKFIRKLDEVAKVRKISRSSLLRDFAMHASDFYDFVVVEKERQQNERIRLNGNLTQFVLDHNPELPADMLQLLSEALKHAAELREAQEGGP